MSFLNDRCDIDAKYKISLKEAVFLKSTKINKDVIIIS